MQRRYIKQISTGRILESQGGGDPAKPEHLQALKDNWMNRGIAGTDLEAGYADETVVNGWIDTQHNADLEADKDYRDKRAERYIAELSPEGNFQKTIGDMIDAILKHLDGDSAELATLKTKINQIKADIPGA